jgi:hypothetical protein
MFGADIAGISKLINTCKDQIRSLTDRAEYQRSKGKLEIAGKQEDIDELSLFITPGLLRDWLNKELIPALRQNEDLRELWRVYDFTRSVSDYWYDQFGYDEVIDNIQDSLEELIDGMSEANGKISVILRARKGVVVELECRARVGVFEEPGFIVSALGSSRRLDAIRLV